MDGEGGKGKGDCEDEGGEPENMDRSVWSGSALEGLGVLGKAIIGECGFALMELLLVLASGWTFEDAFSFASSS